MNSRWSRIAQRPACTRRMCRVVYSIGCPLVPRLPASKISCRFDIRIDPNIFGEQKMSDVFKINNILDYCSFSLSLQVILATSSSWSTKWPLSSHRNWPPTRRLSCCPPLRVIERPWAHVLWSYALPLIFNRICSIRILEATQIC